MRLTRKVGLILGVVAVVGLMSVAMLGVVILGADLKVREERMAQRDVDGAFETIDDDLQQLGGAAKEIVQITNVLFNQDGGSGAGNGTTGGSGSSSGSDLDENATAQLTDALFASNRIDHMFFLMPTSAIEAMQAQAAAGTGASNGTPDPAAEATASMLANMTMTPHGLMMGATYQEGQPLEFGNTSEALTAAVAGSSLITGQPLVPTTGILACGDEPKLVASYGLVMPGVLEETGRIIILRDMDEDYAEFLGQALQTPVRIEAWPSGLPYDEAGQGMEVKRHSLSEMTLIAPKLDADGNPAFRLAIDHDRDVYQSGALAYIYFLGAAIVLILVLGGVAGVLLRKTVTSRVADLAARMRSIGDRKDWQERVRLGGADELADMADAFDGLMGELEAHTAALHKSNDDLGRFASVVSHDLQSPLSTFTLNLPMLRATAMERGDEHSLGCIDRMQSTVERMHSRIRAILDYSRSHSNEPAKDVVPLGQIITDVQQDLAFSIHQTGARVEVRELPVIQGDAPMLTQLFQNLLSNALKYHKPDEPPHVKVWAKEDDGHWHIHVRDHGVGFHSDQVAKMMAPFERLGNHTADGHGIGLATCTRILERLGGSMAVAGRPGEGALFVVRLPRDAASAGA